MRALKKFNETKLKILPVIKLNFTANFGEILVITFPLRSQLFNSVCLIK